VKKKKKQKKIEESEWFARGIQTGNWQEKTLTNHLYIVYFKIMGKGVNLVFEACFVY